jgi:hypothetical protein
MRRGHLFICVNTLIYNYKFSLNPLDLKKWPRLLKKWLLFSPLSSLPFPSLGKINIQKAQTFRIGLSFPLEH